jgi:hypothetical protein
MELESCLKDGLNMIALLKLRYQDPDLPRPYKVNQCLNVIIKFPFSLYS